MRVGSPLLRRRPQILLLVVLAAAREQRVLVSSRTIVVEMALVRVGTGDVRAAAAVAAVSRSCSGTNDTPRGRADD